MATKTMTVDQIDKHLEKYSTKSKTKAAAAPGSATATICALYAKVSPIIGIARGLLFWKPKWQAAIDEFTAALDKVCSV